MIYLDNAATTMPKPSAVYAAVNEAMQSCAGVGRSGHAAALRAAEIVHGCRVAAAKLFDTEPDRVVFTFNATHGLNMAIRTLVCPGDRVVVSGYEHNAVMRPLYAMGAKIVSARSKLFDDDDVLQSFGKAITSETKAVICTHISNVFGNMLPIEAIADLCSKRNIPLIIDAAQSAGCVELSLRRLGAAFIAMPGHKGLLGPQGTGLLLCGQVPEPIMYGGTGSMSLDKAMPSFLPDRAEAGTHHVSGIAGLWKGIEYVSAKGVKNIMAHERRLVHLFRLHTADLPYVRGFFGRNQAGVVSFQLLHTDCEEAAIRLSEHEIAVRAGLHCAPLAHETVGTLEQGTVRISFSAFNKPEEVLSLTEILRDWKN